jgi:N-methylhydantoinase B/oxoprolinase/acetone carboxylase alpha subunit
MRRKTKKALKISAEHAAVALRLLVEDGKVAAADVTRALKNREKLIRDLRARLTALEEAAAPVARRIARAGRKAARRAAPKARKALSRAQRVARQAQGRYLAAIRSLSKDARAKIKAIRKTSGVAAAIKAARKMAA